MRWKIAFLLLAVGLAVLLIQSWESEAANTPACDECGTRCINYCTKIGSYCQYAAPVCFEGDCGPGGCSFICGNGETGSFTCECDNCTPPPGGSPIFRKEETSTPAGTAEPTPGGF